MEYYKYLNVIVIFIGNGFDNLSLKLENLTTTNE